jgi:hypothetical protein
MKEGLEKKRVQFGFPDRGCHPERSRFSGGAKDLRLNGRGA